MFDGLLFLGLAVTFLAVWFVAMQRGARRARSVMSPR